jgi:DNA-binding CsgD family transcriptional regulator
MNKVADEIEKALLSRLSEDKLEQQTQTSIVQWLLGEDKERWETLPLEQRKIAFQGLNYRYQILRERYLNISPTQAYRNLLNRLSSIVSLRQKIKTWVSLSRDRQRAVIDVVQEVIQEMLNSDRYLQSQMAWIAKCTTDEKMRNYLLFASIEEYCLRSIRNQPLLVYRFVNYLRSQSRSGLTQLPKNENIRILSEQVMLDEQENSVSLLDNQALSCYQDQQHWENIETQRRKVQKSFEAYLAENLGQEAVDWLKLYLAGQSQEAIAQSLNLPIQQIYRLREKITYHAIRVFALKEETDLVFEWLEISPEKHNLGLTPKQWESYWERLTPEQQQIFEQLKEGKTLEVIAQFLNCKRSQVIKEWTQLYLIAQELRNSS